MIVRSGMWVHDGQRVGVLFQVGAPIVVRGETRLDPSHAIVHYVDEKGETIAQASVPLASLRQARIPEIPAARLIGTKPATLARLGYSP